jgi:hypothetical protein
MSKRALPIFRMIVWPVVGVDLFDNLARGQYGEWKISMA